MTEPATEKTGLLGRLRQGLAKSTARLTDGISSLFTKARLDSDTLDELEDLLVSADLGVAASSDIVARIAALRHDRDIDGDGVRALIAEALIEMLAPLERPLAADSSHKPHVILVVGVNGTGKTTTIGKLAKHFHDQGRRVMMAAGDTFRAAAIEQLQVWGQRAEAPVITTKVGGDPAGLAYDALSQARTAGSDILLIDTAGRLQNKDNLMAELAKVRRVLAKQDAEAPHEVLLVLDATTGQNALNQIEVFREVAGVTGLVMTKLDGSAKGGVLVAAAKKFALPIHFIGVGEAIADLQPFNARAFARALVGVE